MTSDYITLVVHLESGQNLYPNIYQSILEHIKKHKEGVYLIRELSLNGANSYGVPDENIIFSNNGDVLPENIPIAFHDANIELIGFFQGWMSCVERVEKLISEYARKVEVLTDKVGSASYPTPRG